MSKKAASTELIDGKKFKYDLSLEIDEQEDKQEKNIGTLLLKSLGPKIKVKTSDGELNMNISYFLATSSVIRDMFSNSPNDIGEIDLSDSCSSGTIQVFAEFCESGNFLPMNDSQLVELAIFGEKNNIKNMLPGEGAFDKYIEKIITEKKDNIIYAIKWVKHIYPLILKSNQNYSGSKVINDYISVYMYRFFHKWRLKLIKCGIEDLTDEFFKMLAKFDIKPRCTNTKTCK